MWEREKNNPRRAVFFGPSCRGNFSPYFRRELSVVGQWQAKVMRAGWRSKTVAFVAILALLTFGALATASADPRDLAQSADIAVAQALHSRGLAAWREGKYSEAEGLYKRALAIREKALGASHPDVAQTLNNLEHVPPQLNQGDSRGAKDGRVYRH